MIRSGKILFCENEHGTGDITFPDLDALDAFETKQLFIGKRTAGQLRKEAKQAGWGRINGGDYCLNCMESER
jgi:hypothetical protein